MLVRLQPPELAALMVKWRSWLFPKEQVEVRFLVGVLAVIDELADIKSISILEVYW